MANEERKDFNAMLHRETDMPRIQIVTDEATIRKYGGERMLLAPPLAYDAAMRQAPFGRLITVGDIRAHLARAHGADFTDPITAGIFVSIAAWASSQRASDETPWWRTLKANGELNPKYPGGRRRRPVCWRRRGTGSRAGGAQISGIMWRITNGRCIDWKREWLRPT